MLRTLHVLNGLQGLSHCVKVQVGNRRRGRESHDAPGERLDGENYIQQIFVVV